jgi:hypothetical protein
MQVSRTLAACQIAFALSAEAAEKSFVITIEAGKYDRRGALVEFLLPEAPKSQSPAIKLGDKSVPLQVDADRRATFISEPLMAGASATGQFDPDPPAQLHLSSLFVEREKAGSNKVAFSVQPSSAVHRPKRHRRMAYQAEPGAFPRGDIKPAFRRGGYLHPIYTPSGKLVTDDFPPNHIHHHGVWWAWTNTEFDGRKPDFWNMGDGKGRVEFVGLDAAWNGPVHGGLRARHRFVDLTAPEPLTVLDERWEVRMYASPDPRATYWMFDLVSEQKCATTNALKLPRYHYGGIGVRGNWAWNGKDNAIFLTSEGETDRQKGHATRARWCDMGGMVDGSRVGIAILCHPDNFRAPQPMRIHPTEPFFNFAPQQAGDMEIKPGDKYVSRYRFVVHDGPPDRAELDRLWNDYAHPPVVKVAVK